jgi:hypothetical protein
MIPDTFTVAVDILNNGTTTDKVYERAETFPGRSIFTGDNHSLEAEDSVTFYRTMPKSNGNFKGTGRTTVKTRQDFIVAGADGVAQLTQIASAETLFALPVGMTSAQKLEFRQRHIALLDHELMIDFQDKLNV